MTRPLFMEEVSPSRAPISVGSTSGFTFVEVIVSMAITLIVMASLFALLARGFRTTDAEFERSDLQAQARHALDQISRDLLAAGAGLPPEFPAFTPPDVNPELDDAGGGPEAIEMVGCFDSTAAGVEPWPIVSFDGEKVLADGLPAHIGEGDLVLVFDDEPTNGTWVFGLVSSIEDAGGGVRELTIKTAPGESEGGTTLPSFIEQYNRPSPTAGFMTQVTVVSYKTSPQESGPVGNQVLWRQVNWGEPTQVAFVEDLQFRYFIGTTVAETLVPPSLPPRIFEAPPPPMLNDHLAAPTDSSSNSEEPPPSDDSSSSTSGETTTNAEGLFYPPVPQPHPSQPLLAGDLVRGVGITVTSRSHRANLEGSTVRSGPASDDGFLRVTFASRVAARNVMFNLSSRENQEGFN